MADAGADWFRDLVRAAFASAHPETGERQVGETFCLVPKKNSKTTNSAAAGITALLMNETPNAPMQIIGQTKEIAATFFAQAKGMIEADLPDPETGESYLQNRLHVRDHKEEISDRLNDSTL